MRRLAAALLALTLVVLTPTAALAAKSSTTKDPRGDIVGGGGGIDMKRTTLVKKGQKIVATFTTWGAHSDEDLRAPGGIGVDFRLTKKLVRGAAVRHSSGGLYGEICSYRQRGDQMPKRSRCSKVPAKRLSGTAYRLTIPLKKIDKGAKRLRWISSALAIDSAGCAGVCLDGVGRGKFKTWRL